MHSTFRLIRFTPEEIASGQAACWAELGLTEGPDFALRYTTPALVAAVVNEVGVPLMAPTFFLLAQAIRSRGATGDTVRTYGESLLPWLRFLAHRGQDITSATEEDLKLYRAEQMFNVARGHRKRSTATANLRVTVAAAFHRWCQRNAYQSPLGNYLISRSDGDGSLAARAITRHPRSLSLEEISRLMLLARKHYRLAFRWGLITGMRRFEVAHLLLSDLPRPEKLPFFEDRLANLTILRKGGHEQTVYAPVQLIEDTQWYFHTERPAAASGFENHIFLSKRGQPMQRQAMSREFRRCGQIIGTDATLHHLRHAFAINVLAYLQRKPDQDQGINSLKVVQVLLGHSSVRSTEVYLRAAKISDQLVVDALGYLYGEKS